MIHMDKRFVKLREEIDKVNLDILSLLNNRAALLKNISELKDSYGIDYFDPVRQKEMIETILKNNKGPLYDELVKDIFTTVFTSSLKFMGLNHEKKLLISSSNHEGFQSIKDIFNLPNNTPIIVAGPCAVEKVEFLENIAELLCRYGVKFLRAGAFKPRSSPYDFQGLKIEGLKMLKEVGKKYNLITVSEIVDIRDVGVMSENVDVLQIGARNMQNFELLKEVGTLNKPILLKRGMSATIQELMYAAEYIGLQGNRKIILCERGIRTYETKTRNTLDISSIPIIKKETSLPIMVDLSHSLGRKDIVNEIAKASIAAGADGLMVEVHPNPEVALSDSKQQLNPGEFINLMDSLYSSLVVA
jgi:3-deoxy-7-phosphoheptulonate synthase/chorismate mutase